MRVSQAKETTWSMWKLCASIFFLEKMQQTGRPGHITAGSSFESSIFSIF